MKNSIKTLFMMLIGGTARFNGERRCNTHYPTFAVAPMLASSAVFPNLCSSCLIRSRNCPISTACSLIIVSFSAIIFNRYVGAVSLAGWQISFTIIISPIPLSSHIGDMSGYMFRIFSNLSVPIAPCFLSDLPNDAFAIPMLRSKAATEMPLKSIYCFSRSNIMLLYDKVNAN